jgi:predicted transcriptional regulator of viral defense system
MTIDHAHTALDLVEKRGRARAKDLEAAGIPRVILTRLVRDGRLRRITRGVYGLPEQPVDENDDLVSVAQRSSQGVFCLLTALRFHDLTSQSPFEIWLAIPNKARPPAMDYPPLRAVRFSGPALSEGVEIHHIKDFPIRVYSAAKTVADCFKYRNKIGLDVALEALREAWREKRATMDELWRYARVCRVDKVMQPYLESLT